jgi:anti-sigma regulatory factor (Ser/Thr protein kinase)
MFATLPQELNESYPAVADSVPRARAAVTRFATDRGISGDGLEGIRLAVSEAVTNAVMHAYAGAQGAVHLTAAVTGDELWVLVADDGCGYRADPAQPGLGWGLLLIAQHAEEYVITERATGGTEVRMRFPVPPGRRPANP